MHPQVPNALSASRIAGAFLLLFTGGLNLPFLIIFTVSSLTDIADGRIARKYGLCTATGEKLDSLADFTLVMAMLAVLIPTTPWDPWMIGYIIAVAAVRVVSAAVGYWKYGEVALIHTLMNKTGGLLIHLSPFMMLFMDLGAIVFIVCTVSMAAALEELAINIRSERLDRNLRSCLDLVRTSAK